MESNEQIRERIKQNVKTCKNYGYIGKERVEELEACVKMIEELQNQGKTDNYITDFIYLYIQDFKNIEHSLYNPLIDLVLFLENNNYLVESITTSSGSSFVVIGEDLVWQYYISREIKNNICEMFRDLSNNPIVEDERGEKYDYNIFNYLTQLYFTSCDTGNNIIVWQKIMPISNLDNSFILKNLNKLKNDVKLALSGLHSKRYIHGDCRIDNIGYNGKNFVLLDFDMSKVAFSNEDQQKDFKTFNESLEIKLQEIYKSCDKNK